MTEGRSRREVRTSDANAIERDHDLIRELMAPLETVAARFLGGQLDAPDDASLCRLLYAFRDRLADHFRFEEESGLLAAAMLMRPEPGESVRNWLELHRRLLMGLNGLIWRLEQPRRSLRRPGFPGRELAEFLMELRKHDEYENGLLGHTRSAEFRIWQRSYETH